MVSGLEKFAGLKGIEISLVGADCGSIRANVPTNANSAAVVRIIKLLGWICTGRAGADRSAVARPHAQRLFGGRSSAAWVIRQYPQRVEAIDQSDPIGRSNGGPGAARRWDFGEGKTK